MVPCAASRTRQILLFHRLKTVTCGFCVLRAGYQCYVIPLAGALLVHASVSEGDRVAKISGIGLYAPRQATKDGPVGNAQLQDLRD